MIGGGRERNLRRRGQRVRDYYAGCSIEFGSIQRVFCVECIMMYPHRLPQSVSIHLLHTQSWSIYKKPSRNKILFEDLNVKGFNWSSNIHSCCLLVQRLNRNWPECISLVTVWWRSNERWQSSPSPTTKKGVKMDQLISLKSKSRLIKRETPFRAQAQLLRESVIIIQMYCMNSAWINQHVWGEMDKYSTSHLAGWRWFQFREEHIMCNN